MVCILVADHIKELYGSGAVQAFKEQEYNRMGKIKDQAEFDNVNHPAHYTAHASGIECIQVTEHMNFCLGNALKYLWRAGLKNDNAIEDLKKSIWYINREIKRLENDK